MMTETIHRSESMGVIISKEPWPADPIANYQNISDGAWGYLIHDSAEGLIFDDSERPSDAAIMDRWGYYLRRVSVLGN